MQRSSKKAIFKSLSLHCSLSEVCLENWETPEMELFGTVTFLKKIVY